jgi:hypothetical protein
MDFHHVNMGSPDTPPTDALSDSGASNTAADLSSAVSTTIASLLSGYSSLSVPTLLAPLSPDFHHHILPESLGTPIRDREAFTRHAAGIFAVFDSFRLEPVLTLPVLPLRTESYPPVVVIRAKMIGVLKGGKGPWETECVMIIWLSADGTEVIEIQEFVDSAKALVMAKRHAPEEFGAEGTERKARDVGGLIHVGIPTNVSFVWLIFSIVLSKVFGGTLALAVLWMHPVLEMVRKSIAEELSMGKGPGAPGFMRKYWAFRHGNKVVG